MKKQSILLIISMFFVIILCPEKTSTPSPLKNGKNPLIGNFKLKLIEKTYIMGIDSPDEYFVGIYDMAIDSKENLYLVTWGKVLKYNKYGKFKRVFCNIKGEGPGELKNEPSRIYVDQKDNLFITDSYQIVHFNQRGEFVKNIKVFGAEDFVVSKGQYVFCMKYIYKGNRNNRYIALKQFDFSGQIVKELFSAKNQITVKMPGGANRYYLHDYTPKIYFNYTNSGGIIFGYNGDYTIYITNSDGIIFKTIKVSTDKKPVTNNEKQHIKKKKRSSFSKNVPGINEYCKYMPFPEYRPFFNRLLSDEKGRIYVVRIQSVLNRKEHEVVDIFSKKGCFLYSVNMPYVPEIIRNGVIYVVDRSDEEDIIVKKLVIENYEAMRF